MFDLIAVSIIFYAGFWCGKKFGTIKALFVAAKKKIDEALA